MTVLTEEEEVLIAEYAIGLTGPDQDLRVQRLLSHPTEARATEARAALGFWSERLLAMTKIDQTAEAPDVFPALQRRLFGTKPKMRPTKILYWGLIVVAVALAIKLNVLILLLNGLFP